MQQYVAATCLFGTLCEETFLNKSKYREPEVTGYDWVIRILNNPTSCYDMFKMSRELFYKLHDSLVSFYGLVSSKMSCREFSLVLVDDRSPLGKLMIALRDSKRRLVRNSNKC